MFATAEDSPQKAQPMKKTVPANQVIPTLHQINARMKKLMDSKAITTEEMEALSAEAWKIQVAYHHRLNQLEFEKNHMNSQILHMWKNLESVLFPVLELDNSLLPVYKELTDILQCLTTLETKGDMFMNADSKDCALVLLQDRLHKLDRQRVDGVFFGKDKPKTLVNSQIASGQAICSSLLAKCYHLVTKIQNQPNDDSAKEPPSRLDALNHSLAELLTCLKAGFDFNPSFLALLIDEAHFIESKKVDGVFMEADGTVAADQELLHKQLDLTHDLINECILSYEEDAELLKSQKPNAYDLEAISKQLQEARVLLYDQLEFPDLDFRPSMVYEELVQPAYDAIQFLEHKGEEIASSSAKKLYSLAQSAFGYASKLSFLIDPVDESLLTTRNSLQDLVSSLKQLRNTRALSIIKNNSNDEKLDAELQSKLEQYQLKLNEIGNQRVGDKFLGKGGDSVKALYDQSQALINSMI